MFLFFGWLQQVGYSSINPTCSTFTALEISGKEFKDGSSEMKVCSQGSGALAHEWWLPEPNNARLALNSLAKPNRTDRNTDRRASRKTETGEAESQPLIRSI